jgi:hypothetical protein
MKTGMNVEAGTADAELVTQTRRESGCVRADCLALSVADLFAGLQRSTGGWAKRRLGSRNLHHGLTPPALARTESSAPGCAALPEIGSTTASGEARGLFAHRIVGNGSRSPQCNRYRPTRRSRRKRLRFSGTRSSTSRIPTGTARLFFGEESRSDASHA